ncbi:MULTISPECIES: CbtB domain-containing protein [Massilia]|uniref:Cobalt transporter n=1 Tax=Massilia violaceinigra TaxID=2045208 RepID=A0A2D2DS86_9BURK|nr:MULTISPECIES: CbtB domain-containing protein [Massilia]ATQ77827.1 cobalt transporter [Massilia violaceinigra]MDQ1832212.1 CbtB domain-containing protein [Massilia sp. CCM 9029]MDQ1923240.1 CbtB domain-containing protein [Massilia sp. CCM 9206]
MSPIRSFITTADEQVPFVSVKERIVQAMCAASLGIVLLYGAGFASMEALHNAAHDSRHSAGFPCH